MAHYNRDWQDLVRSIHDTVDWAVRSQDYHQLNQTIRQAVNTAVDVGSTTVKRAVTPMSRPQTTVLPANRNLYGSTSGETAKGIALTVGGGVLSLTMFLSFLGTVVIQSLFSGFMVAPVIPLLGMAAGGWMIYRGAGILGMLSRFRTYRNILGNKTFCPLERLAGSVGKNVKFVRNDVWKMIGKGLFLEGHMDKEQTALITSHETYRNFEQNRLQLEQRQRLAAEAKAKTAGRDPQVQEVLDRGNAFVAEIRRCNDAIPGEEISEKISRMELIVRRIFQRAEADPEIVPDLKKMMDYYLPMTVKLLNAYAEMDAQPVQGETIQASKREIEETLDTLNLAFEKILDSVFSDTAMDVSSDISVLNTLLAQEGLAEDELSKLKKQQNT